jgi:hypothetical protein
MINITINNESNVVNLINGYYSLVLSDFPSGNYTVKLELLNDTYVTDIIEKNFTINIKSSQIIANDFIAYYNGGNNYEIILKDNEGNPISNKEVFFTINNRTFKKTTNSEGIVSMSITLPIGNYSVDIVFMGDNSFINSSSHKNIVVKGTILLPENKDYLFNTQYSLKLLNKDGNPLNNTNVIIKVNNIEYNKKTDVNGFILLNIEFNPGIYALSIVNPINGEKSNDVVTVIPRIINNQDLIMYFGYGKTYSVRIYGDDGNPVGADEIVNIKVNGKLSKIKTDKNGFASYKINLNPKTYTVSAEYKGYSVYNKITVKPVLTAKNISKKKSKKIKFSAKLVNGNGKGLKGKKIVFKFKGKTYKVKTNSKGIAKLTLKKLKIGKYKITTKYGKSTIKNTIKIRK